MMENNIITVFGGTGFIGRYVVRELAKTGALIRVVSRSPRNGAELKTFGYVGQITLEKGNILSRDAIDRNLQGTDMVVNLVGILHEGGKQRFSRVHSQGAERIAQAAQDAGVKRLVQISALGIEKAKSSKYARTKLTGEKAVNSAFPGATILRPSIVFGPEDDFFNRFATIASMAPVMPLIGGGKTRFQPIYAGDVAQAICAALKDKRTEGQTYQLGGPKVYRFKELLQYIMEETGHHRPFLSIPFGVAKLMGFFMEWLPTPPLTRDQVTLLQTDNIVADDAQTLSDLGVTPRAVEMICPEYLYRFRRGGKFSRQTMRLS